MNQVSARRFLGLSVLSAASKSHKTYGTIETVLISPRLFVVEGFLIGHANSKEQQFLPRECIGEVTDHSVAVYKCTNQPKKLQRILGLQAWKQGPKLPLGFVYDVSFSLEDGLIDTFVIHQLLRTWPIPRVAVDKITPKSLLLDTDTTIRLNIDTSSSGV